MFAVFFCFVFFFFFFCFVLFFLFFVVVFLFCFVLFCLLSLDKAQFSFRFSLKPTLAREMVLLAKFMPSLAGERPVKGHFHR